MLQPSLAADKNKAVFSIRPASLLRPVGSEEGVRQNKSDDTVLTQRAGVSEGGASAPLYPSQKSHSCADPGLVQGQRDGQKIKRGGKSDEAALLVTINDPDTTVSTHGLGSLDPRHKTGRQSVESLGKLRDQVTLETPPSPKRKGKPVSIRDFFGKQLEELMGLLAKMGMVPVRLRDKATFCSNRGSSFIDVMSVADRRTGERFISSGLGGPSLKYVPRENRAEA